ncbi:hypothetical protein ACGFJ7_18050 [Actinoplanes sp. NPDC048988]|uniref:hypothetical protein n=1 Tax=Actinoplanes sp. NPDC048988 TaxID=3363901 RepID=UPI0037197704
MSQGPVDRAVAPSPTTTRTRGAPHSPSASTSQPAAVSSATLAAGPSTYSPAFWSQAEVSQSAASAAGVAPPTTKPKKRPLDDAITPGSAAATRSATTFSGGSEPGRSGPPSAARICSSDADGRTGRSGRPPRYAVAWSKATPGGPFQSGRSLP